MTFTKFYSRTLNGAELNYDAHDKELLAIFEAFMTWQHHLEFLVVRDDHLVSEMLDCLIVATRQQLLLVRLLATFATVVP
jgi:hypothetical protein